jgi:hypothetical protein
MGHVAVMVLVCPMFSTPALALCFTSTQWPSDWGRPAVLMLSSSVAQNRMVFESPFVKVLAAQVSMLFVKSQGHVELDGSSHWPPDRIFNEPGT